MAEGWVSTGLFGAGGDGAGVAGTAGVAFLAAFEVLVVVVVAVFFAAMGVCLSHRGEAFVPRVVRTPIARCGPRARDSQVRGRCGAVARSK
jgi:hypothetical protein